MKGTLRGRRKGTLKVPGQVVILIIVVVSLPSSFFPPDVSRHNAMFDKPVFFNVLSRPATAGSISKHLMCWTTTTMWTQRSWPRASPTCSTQSSPSPSPTFSRRAESAWQLEAPSCVLLLRFSLICLKALLSSGKVLLLMEILPVFKILRTQLKGRSDARVSAWSTRSASIERCAASNNL